MKRGIIIESCFNHVAIEKRKKKIGLKFMNLNFRFEHLNSIIRVNV